MKSKMSVPPLTVLATSHVAVYGKYRTVSDFIKKLFVCVLKMSESLAGSGVTNDRI